MQVTESWRAIFQDRNPTLDYNVCWFHLAATTAFIQLHMHGDTNVSVELVQLHHFIFHEQCARIFTWKEFRGIVIFNRHQRPREEEEGWGRGALLEPETQAGRHMGN